MLPTDHAFFRHFWYPVLPSDQLRDDQPTPFTLLGEAIVLWRDGDKAVALRDRCSHRSAKLSLGVLKDGCLRCPYHGWEFRADGSCAEIPQLDRPPSDKHAVDSFACEERYGYVWVALGDPIRPIPRIEEDEDESLRRVPCFYETWETSAFRTMENELDMAHFSYVHMETFGHQGQLVPKELDLTDIDDYTLHLRAKLSTIAPPAQAANTQMPEGESSRVMNITWFMPFVVRLDLAYQSGLRHVIVNCSTPIDGGRVQVVQFHYRSDDEATVSTEQLIAFESKIVAEDRAVLEATDPHVELFDFQEEAHMPTDRAGLMMRKKLAAAIRAFEADAPEAAARTRRHLPTAQPTC